MTTHPKDAHQGNLTQYISVFISLCILTAVSFAVGNSATLREKSPGVMIAMMMAVSCAKALLVILFFMHLKWEANWKYVLTIPASLMSLFLVLMLVPDIGRRTRVYSEERLLHAAEPISREEELAEYGVHKHDEHGSGAAHH